eukprot:TRINITY_DN3820_c0_g1_i1.p1 TRINITY_DN3820_c0_g1~~TRINITY_DN3820_c0_g1_i1.p1  ORF type:complete len:611 (+),score=147.46 TRINITY_DN3820_c0_g1_i1:162-1994(+)
MGFLRKLSFWKRSTKATAVEPFQQPGDELLDVPQVQTKKGMPAETVLDLETGPTQPAGPASKAGAPKSGHESDVPSKVSPASPQQVTSSPDRSATTTSPPAASACSADSEACKAPSGASSPSKGSKAKAVSFQEPATRTPSPEDVEGEDCLNFDASLEHTRAEVSEAFGQMIGSSLQSTKWDKRSQALKAITQVLKGLDLEGMAPPGSTGVLGRGLKLRDRTRCWRLSCQLLHHVMRDKVMPVRLAALELFQDTFANTEGIEQAEVRYAAGVLIEHLIDRVGDSNLRLHESARKCILFAAERPGLLGLGQVLSRLRSKIDSCPKGGERNKVHFGILDTVCVLLEHFPGRREKPRGAKGEPSSPKSDNSLFEDDDEPRSSDDSWSAQDVAPFIVAGMDDALGPRVRNSAVALAESVFATFGIESMQPILKSLRPAKQTLLKNKFKEMEDDQIQPPEDDDGEEGEARPDLDGLLICGAAVRPAPAAPASMQLPGAMGGGDEECMMDGILEEAGMVFNGTGIVNEASRSPVFGLQDFAPEDEDDALLEQELMALGLDEDLEALDEQEALLSSLADLEGNDEGRHIISDNLSVEAGSKMSGSTSAVRMTKVLVF